MGLGDLSVEDVEFVPAQDSPTGKGLLAVAHEVSGSINVYEVRPSRDR